MTDPYSSTPILPRVARPTPGQSDDRREEALRGKILHAPRRSCRNVRRQAYVFHVTPLWNRAKHGIAAPPIPRRGSRGLDCINWPAALPDRRRCEPYDLEIMFYIDILYALLVAIFLAAVLLGLVGWRRSPSSSGWADALFLFLVFFLLIWAGGVWLEPFGPVLWGGYWLPFVAVGLIALLLLAAAGTSRRRVRRYDDSRIEPARVANEDEGKAVAVAFGAFFWFLLLALVVAIAARYVTGPHVPLPAI